MDTMVNAAKRDAGSTQHLQELLGQDIIVPAKTVGLSDLDQFLPGKVVDLNTEDDSLWCTVSGDKRWYRWHMEDVRSWLLPPGKRSSKACSMPASNKDNPTSRRLPQSPPGKSQRLHLAGSKPRPKAPGPEQLWKYCKRCNSWKERPGDFSKNHRTPDGLQFYCRFCHNRMTKFNQQRRLENRHIAEKHHHLIKSSRKGPPARIARASHASSTSRSPSSHSRESLEFDVISSKVPRQQRTHAIYRKDSDPASSTGPSPHRQQPLKSPSPIRNTTAAQPAKAQRSLGSDNGICHHGSHASSKQQQLFKPKPRRSPSAQARASADLMLQANAVLQELDQSLLQAVEAASAEVAASTAQAASRHASTAELQLPVSPSAKAPQSPVAAPRVVSSASPRACVQSPQRHCSRLGPGGSVPPGPPSPPPQPLQHRSSSMPAQQLTHPPSSSTHTLSHSLAQLRQACCVDPASAHNRDKEGQHQQSEKLTQQLTTIKAPQLLSKVKSPAAHSGSVAAEHAVPDAASEPQSDTHELKQRSSHAEGSKECSPGRSETGVSHVSQGRPVQGLPGDQPPLPDLAVAPSGEPPSTAAVGLADLTKAKTEALGRSPPRTAGSPAGPIPGSALDVSSHPGPPAGPTPPELDPRTSPEPAEPSLKKRKVPRLAAPSQVGDQPECITLDPDETGRPNGTADADGSCGRQPSCGAQRASDKTSACTTANQAPDLPSATAASQHGKRPIAASLASLPVGRSSQPIGSMSLPIGSVSLPIGTLPMPSGGSLPTTAPLDNLGAIITALSQCTSHQQLQAFFLDLQAQGNCQQVLQELEKHFKSACQNPASLYMGAGPFLPPTTQPPPYMTTAAAARPQLQPTSAASGQPAPFAPNPSKLCRSGTSASLPLLKKFTKKRSRPQSSNASLEAAINSLRSDTTPSPSATLSDSQILPPGTFPSSGLTANMPLTAFSSSAAVRLVVLAGATGSQGIPGTGPASGNPATSFGPAGSAAASSAAGAAGPSSGAALELSLLLTTLQSLAQLPGEQGQPINLIASSSQVAEAQLRDWLRQLQQHAAHAPGEVSAAQQTQEDAVIAAQVRREMWGNMQSIVAMLAGQGCSPHVQDMVHQIAVHFASEQSQSVALERRMTSNLSREKDAQKQLQQQLRGGIQVLSSLQKVLGAVRMQQQRAKSAVDQSAHGIGSDSHSISQLRQRVAQAESGEATAQQAVRALQKKEAGWEAELGAAQASNAQLHSQVAQLRQEKAALQEQNDKHDRRWERLAAEFSDSEDSPDNHMPMEQMKGIEPSHN